MTDSELYFRWAKRSLDAARVSLLCSEDFNSLIMSDLRARLSTKAKREAFLSLGPTVAQLARVERKKRQAQK